MGHKRCAQLLANSYRILDKRTIWYTDWDEEIKLTGYDPFTSSGIIFDDNSVSPQEFLGV